MQGGDKVPDVRDGVTGVQCMVVSTSGLDPQTCGNTNTGWSRLGGGGRVGAGCPGTGTGAEGGSCAARL